MDKPLELTYHVRQRMVSRGATQDEVIRTIREGLKEPAKRGTWHSVFRFEFNRASPVNGLMYSYKTVDAVFAEEPDRIVVLTVKTYYHNEQGGDRDENHIRSTS